MRVNIFWFRRDLRLFDNHGLFRALKSGQPVLPVFIFDKNILNELSDKNDRRVFFIYDCLKKIHEQLVQLGSSLHMFYDTPQNAFKKLIKEYRIGEVFTNHDYEPYAIKRDEEVLGLLKELGIRFSSYKEQVIFEKNEVLKPDRKPYTIFTPYSKTWKAKLLPESLASFPSEENFSS